METKRLYRSATNRTVGGVASGLATYFNLDPMLVRLLFVIFTLFGGGAVIIYIVLWIVTPTEPIPHENNQKQSPMETQEHASSSMQDPDKNNPIQKKIRGNLIGGLVLITLGGIFLADQFIPNIDFGDLWPIILIVIGIALLVNAFGKTKKNNL
jgi:phage shock protein C